MIRVIFLAAWAAAAGPWVWAASGGPGGETPPDGGTLLAMGCDKFFAGDLSGAADDWALAHARGQREAGNLAVLALTVLGKEALKGGDYLSAAVHATHGLEVSPSDAVLSALFRLAEDEKRFKKRPDPKSLDASVEQEKLIARVLRIDVASPRLSPGPTGEPEASGSQALLRQVFAEDKDFRLDRMLRAVQQDEDALRAADRARLSRAWRRRRAKYSYQQGLPAYYSGDFETAAKWFREAAALDPNLKEAKAGLKGCEAALGQRN
ncbi:MAG: hypothetical protein HY553_15310 [Elusimicrobia bacterium]|nr:hypothetical protein [Elusimicrobiota bacterium]